MAGRCQRLLTPEPVKARHRPSGLGAAHSAGRRRRARVHVGSLAELKAEVRARFMDEIEKAYGKNFNMLRLDIDALRHKIRKLAGAGVIELPSILGSERQRAN